MTRYFCDICGKELDIDTDMIDMLFHSYMKAGNELKNTVGERTELQVCVKCSCDIFNAVDRLKAKHKKKDGDGDG